MTAALATIVFLSAAWFAIVSIAGAAEFKTSRILAALRGEAAPDYAPVKLRVKARYPSARQSSARVQPTLRAAA